MVCVLALAVSQSRAGEEHGPKKPQPGPEMARLKCMLGTWTGTAEIISPAPEGGDEAQTAFKGQSTSEWALGGMYLKSEGWHEMGGGQKMHYVEYVTWDAEAGKYHGWYFSNWGEAGESWMTVSDDGKTWSYYGKSKDAEGNPTKGKGTVTFIDEDTMEWTWTEKGSEGEMHLKGTSKRTS